MDKSYKLINMPECFDKIMNMGLTRERIRPYNHTDTFLFINGNEYHSSNNIEHWGDSDFQEITKKDFLELPEPSKIGDWLMSKQSGLSFMRIDDIDFQDKKYMHTSKSSKTLIRDDYKYKATLEQVKVLNLV